MTESGSDIACPPYGEVQAKHDYLCARRGASWETKAQRHVRRTELEQSRREAEHNDASIQRFPGFGTNGTSNARWGSRKFFNQMSNQMRRRYFAVVVFIAICFVLIVSR